MTLISDTTYIAASISTNLGHNLQAPDEKLEEVKDEGGERIMIKVRIMLKANNQKIQRPSLILKLLNQGISLNGF